MLLECVENRSRGDYTELEARNRDRLSRSTKPLAQDHGARGHGSFRNILSPTYILSGEDGVEVDLGDVGNLSAIFSSIYPDQEWLSDLFNWFIRLASLHRLWLWRENCDSNILQIAWSLSATLPCDKYYALCGVLRLKKLKCVSSHTESEAFQAVILALTQAGRLS
jgi:hypothetical protein